jgi:hypothetical protein
MEIISGKLKSFFLRGPDPPTNPIRIIRPDPTSLSALSVPLVGRPPLRAPRDRGITLKFSARRAEHRRDSRRYLARRAIFGARVLPQCLPAYAHAVVSLPIPRAPAAALLLPRRVGSRHLWLCAENEMGMARTDRPGTHVGRYPVQARADRPSNA